MCPTIGPALRTGRLRRGLTLQDAAHKTRISAPRLRALEQDDFATFGNSVYARSFLKLYSDFLQVDATPTLEWLYFNPPQSAARPAGKGAAAVTADLPPSAHAGYNLWTGETKEQSRAKAAPSPVPAAIATFAILLTGVSFWINALAQDWQVRQAQIPQPAMQQAAGDTMAYKFRVNPPGRREPRQIVAAQASAIPTPVARTN